MHSERRAKLKSGAFFPLSRVNKSLKRPYTRAEIAAAVRGGLAEEDRMVISSKLFDECDLDDLIGLMLLEDVSGVELKSFYETTVIRRDRRLDLFFEGILSGRGEFSVREPKAEALRWFLQSEDDFQFVEWMRSESIFFDKGCFFAQQAGEKALAACLYAAGARHVLGYSLFEMVNRLSLEEPDFQWITDEARRLDGFHIPTRYPDGLSSGAPFQIYTARDLAMAFEDVKKVMDLCRSYLQGQQVLVKPER